MLNKKEENIITNKIDLRNIFEQGFNKEKRLGVEYEKLGVYKDSFHAITYEDVLKIIEKINPYDYIIKDGKIIGAKCSFGTLTLEPGSQFEISLPPEESLDKISETIQEYNDITDAAADDYGINWLGCGNQPITTYNEMKIIPKKRYDYMTQYFSTTGKYPYVMMRETAGIQVSVDFESEEDAMYKFSTALKLSPIMTAVFANSPIRKGRFSGYKSFRANAWLSTDEKRCGLINKKVLENNADFDDYIEYLLDIPMIFIERDKKNIPTNKTFRDFLKGKISGEMPTFDDWARHISLSFTEVRMKNYLEIRNHDSQRNGMITAIPAFWKGIIYNKSALNAVNEIFKPFNYKDFQECRFNVPKMGLQTKMGNYYLKDIALEVLNISNYSLKTLFSGEEKYLENIIKLVEIGNSPADIIINRVLGKDKLKYMEIINLGLTSRIHQRLKK